MEFPILSVVFPCAMYRVQLLAGECPSAWNPDDATPHRKSEGSGPTLSAAFAQEDSPDALVKKVTEEVLTIVRQDKDIQSGNTRKAIELVEAKVLPHFDFRRMTMLAVGRDWRQASAEQQYAGHGQPGQPAAADLVKPFR